MNKFILLTSVFCLSFSMTHADDEFRGSYKECCSYFKGLFESSDSKIRNLDTVVRAELPILIEKATNQVKFEQSVLETTLREYQRNRDSFLFHNQQSEWFKASAKQLESADQAWDSLSTDALYPFLTLTSQKEIFANDAIENTLRSIDELGSIIQTHSKLEAHIDASSQDISSSQKQEIPQLTSGLALAAALIKLQESKMTIEETSETAWEQTESNDLFSTAETRPALQVIAQKSLDLTRVSGAIAAKALDFNQHFLTLKAEYAVEKQNHDVQRDTVEPLMQTSKLAYEKQTIQYQKAVEHLQYLAHRNIDDEIRQENRNKDFAYRYWHEWDEQDATDPTDFHHQTSRCKGFWEDRENDEGVACVN